MCIAPPGAGGQSLCLQLEERFVMVLSILLSFYCFMIPKRERKMADVSFLLSCLQDGMYTRHPATPERAAGGANGETEPQREQGLDCFFPEFKE